MYEMRRREVRTGGYVIECVATGQFYVGGSSHLDERKACHWAPLRRGKHHTACLKEAWVQYGEGAFTFRAVEIVGDPSFRRQAERRHAEALEAASPGRSLCERLPVLGFDPERGGAMGAAIMGRWPVPGPRLL